MEVLEVIRTWRTRFQAAWLILQGKPVIYRVTLRDGKVRLDSPGPIHPVEAGFDNLMMEFDHPLVGPKVDGARWSIGGRPT